MVRPRDALQAMTYKVLFETPVTMVVPSKTAISNLAGSILQAAEIPIVRHDVTFSEKITSHERGRPRSKQTTTMVSGPTCFSTWPNFGENSNH